MPPLCAVRLPLTVPLPVNLPLLGRTNPLMKVCSPLPSNWRVATDEPSPTTCAEPLFTVELLADKVPPLKVMLLPAWPSNPPVGVLVANSLEAVALPEIN